MPKGSPELAQARREKMIDACEKLYQTMRFKEITSQDIGAAATFGRTYNPMLPELERLNAALKEIADRHGVSVAQLPVAWAITKGTLPIIGVTKVDQVEDAVQAAALELSQDEIQAMEALGDQAGLNVIRYWEKEMK